ncbi:hypothetical protein ACFLQ6_04900 [Thermoproteota archaeon]
MKMSVKISLIVFSFVSIAIILLAFNEITLFTIKSSAPEIHATKLAVIIDGDNIQHPGRECKIVIRAVDDNGVLDTSRNDTIQIAINAGPTARVSSEIVTLKNGEATVMIITYVSELVYIYAYWVSGPSYLDVGHNLVHYI